VGAVLHKDKDELGVINNLLKSDNVGMDKRRKQPDFLLEADEDVVGNEVFAGDNLARKFRPGIHMPNKDDRGGGAFANSFDVLVI
jgi:hypothetical protein